MAASSVSSNVNGLTGVLKKTVIAVTLVTAALLLAFYNLGSTPGLWHDEGAAITVSKTLVEDGVYASKNSDGYQTFGPIQSVGPTVLLPVALSFKVFGSGLIQARIVAGIFLIFTLLIFYQVGQVLFGYRIAWLGVALLVGSSAVVFLQTGRQVGAQIPAFGFFLSGWLVWVMAVRSQRWWLGLVAGILIGLAMITKGHYIILASGTIALIIVLDLRFYRQGSIKTLIAMGVVSAACVVAWQGSQYLYFGPEVYRENAALLNQLMKSSNGLDLRMRIEAITQLLGTATSHFYYFLGPAAVVYAGALSLRRSQEGLTLAFLVIFTVLWLSYYLLWSTPWVYYAFAPLAISALFVGKLLWDLAQGSGYRFSWQELRAEVRSGHPGRATLASVALLGLGLMVFYPLQSAVRVNVLSASQHTQNITHVIGQTISKDAVIETWERELPIITDQRYHFPDQSLLIATQEARYRGGSYDYALGKDYFLLHRPAYLIVGPFARIMKAYDTTFITEYGKLIATINDTNRTYEIYKLDLPSQYREIIQRLDIRPSHRTFQRRNC